MSFQGATIVGLYITSVIDIVNEMTRAETSVTKIRQNFYTFANFLK